MENYKLKAALFDLDGVVFDTEPQYTVFWGSQCRLYHPEHPGLEQEIKGQTLTQIYDQWFSGPLEKEQEVITDRLNEFEQQMHYDYIEGFEALIADLHAHGVKTAVVTSSNMPKMESVYLHQPDFKTLFDAILTGLRSGRAAKMKVVGLTTTNPKEAISALSDIQISDYQNISFDTLESLLTSHKS